MLLGSAIFKKHMVYVALSAAVAVPVSHMFLTPVKTLP